MRITTTYKDRDIEIVVTEVRGGWRWSYTINGNSLVEGADRPLPTREIAENEALQHVHTAINNSAN